MINNIDKRVPKKRGSAIEFRFWNFLRLDKVSILKRGQCALYLVKTLEYGPTKTFRIRCDGLRLRFSSIFGRTFSYVKLGTGKSGGRLGRRENTDEPSARRSARKDSVETSRAISERQTSDPEIITYNVTKKPTNSVRVLIIFALFYSQDRVVSRS